MPFLYHSLLREEYMSREHKCRGQDSAVIQVCDLLSPEVGVKPYVDVDGGRSSLSPSICSIIYGAMNQRFCVSLCGAKAMLS